MKKTIVSILLVFISTLNVFSQDTISFKTLGSSFVLAVNIPDQNVPDGSIPIKVSETLSQTNFAAQKQPDAINFYNRERLICVVTKKQSRLITKFNGHVVSGLTISTLYDSIQTVVAGANSGGGGGGSGIVETIVAGYNITVDNSDPANPVLYPDPPLLTYTVSQAVSAQGAIPTEFYGRSAWIIDPEGIEGTIFFTNVIRTNRLNNIGIYYRDLTGFGENDFRNYFNATFSIEDNELQKLSNNTLEINSAPTSILNQMIASTNGIAGFVNSRIGFNCSVGIDVDCQGWDGVTIADDQDVAFFADSKGLNLTLNAPLISIELPSSIGQANNAWKGNVQQYDSDVEVIYPTLSSSATSIDLNSYKTFGGVFYVQSNSTGNDIDNITDGYDKRNYKIVNIGASGGAEVLNFTALGNLVCNTFFIGLPINCANNNGTAKDCIYIQYDGNGSVCIIKSAETY